MRELLIKESGEKTYDYISKFVDIKSEDVLITATNTPFSIAQNPKLKLKGIVNLKRVNDIRRINKFFEGANAKLEYGGLFVGSVETFFMRKQHIYRKYPFIINRIVYFFDFIIRRVFPKIIGFKKLYFMISRGHNRLLSKAETLGRLYSCGFEIVDETFFEDRLHFVVRKIKEPAFDDNPTYGPLITLKRQGKDGKIINVYKMRTMHAYSEYLQEYVYKTNSLQEGGKFDNDFRITTIGKILRKFWLDELPMLINWIKRDLKIVGVRPLSEHYLSLYPKEFRERRKKYRPGLLPPFYVDLPKNIDEIVASEIKYLDAYDKHPIATDIKYFFKAFVNIVFKRARSK